MEIEAKIKLTPHEATKIVERLIGEGGWRRVYEINTLFDRNMEYVNADRVIRMREEGDFSTPDLHSVMTYKGPRLDGEFNTREEVNLHLDEKQGESMRQILAGMGLKPSFQYAKIRMEQSSLAGTVCMDELPYLGFFLEVEAENEAMVAHILRKHGFYGRESIKQGYASLLKNFAAENPGAVPDPTAFRFNPERILNEQATSFLKQKVDAQKDRH